MSRAKGGHKRKDVITGIFTLSKVTMWCCYIQIQMFELHKVQRDSLYLRIHLTDIPTEFIMKILGTAKDYC